ncbi:integrase core domain-containing protein, partial [Streptosporangium longisporum]
QYTSADYTALAERLGVRLSVGRTGQCWDNALAESFFATLKGEFLNIQPWPTRSAARSAIFEFIEGWYNLHRLHSSLSYRSPADYEAARAA